MKLTLIRHGQSEWNNLNLFTGWEDVRLTEQGIEEAKKAGQALKALDIPFETVYTSVLSRAIQTTYYVLSEADRLYLPVTKAWQLNERHYGGLQGLNKAETAEKYGDEQVHIWRRSFDVTPPNADEGAHDVLTHDPRYKGVNPSLIPYTESLKITMERTLPYFDSDIAPRIKAGENVLIVAHGNSLRSLIKTFENISDEDIPQLEIATGVPIIYDIDEALNVVDKHVVR